jgi:hypothetical protein
MTEKTEVYLLVGQTFMPVIHDETRVLCGACIRKYGMYQVKGTKLTNFCSHNRKYHASQKQPNPEIPVAGVDGWADDIGGDIEDGAPIAGVEAGDLAGEMVRMVGELAGLKTQLMKLTSGLKEIYKLVKKLGAEKAPVEEVTTPAVAAALPEESESVELVEPPEQTEQTEPAKKKQKKTKAAKAVAKKKDAPVSAAGSSRKRCAPGRLHE